MANVTIDFTANLARFSSSIDRMVSDLNKFQTNATRMERNVSRTFRMISAAIPAGLFINFIKGTIDAADNLKDLSDRTDVSIKTLASYKVLAEQTGTSLEAVARGISRVTLSISQANEGNAGMQESLRKLGITARDPQKAFEQLAEKVKNTNDMSEIAADLQKVLSRNYMELIPLLRNGAQGLQDAAKASESFATQMARLAPNADAFNDQLIALRANTAAAAGGILSEMLPSLNTWIDRVNILINRYGALRGVMTGLGAALVPGITAGDATRDASAARAREEIKKAQKELTTIEAAVKTKTFGLIQLLLYGSWDEMVRKGEYLKRNIQTLKEGVADFEKRSAIKPKIVPEIDTGNLDAMFECLAQPGMKWDGKKCVKIKGAGGGSGTIKLKVDPLKSVLESTPLAQLEEAQKKIDLLNQRFAAGRIGPTQYAQALAIVRGEVEKINDELRGNEIATPFGKLWTVDPSTAEALREITDSADELAREINTDLVAAAKAGEDALAGLISQTAIGQTQELYDKLALVDKALFDMKISDELHAQIVELLTGVEEIAEKTNDIGKQLGFTFNSAFEGAVIEGKKLRDVLQGIFDDILRIILRTQVTKPLSEAIGTIDWGSLFGFRAKGGIIGPNIPIEGYAAGGIVNMPKMIMVGEGDKNEAVVPLPDGRSIPVDMQGTVASNVVVNVVEAPGKGGQTSDKTVGNMRVIDIMVEQIKAAVGNDILKGGGSVASALERTYGLNRSSGAY